MSKHTPGPWYLEEPNLKKQRVDISTDEACPTTGVASWRGLARVYGCVDWPKSGTAAMMANARLIAAAPDLLEAAIQSIPLLEEYMQLGIDTDAPDSADAFEAVLLIMKHAITKATGADHE